MRIRTVCIVNALFLLSGFCFGQGTPVPALTNPFGNDISLSYMLVEKNRSFNLGNGGDITATHYLTRHIGIIAETEAMTVSRWQIHEYAVRAGASYRFNDGADIQPFVRASAGFSKVNASYHANRPIHDFGGSLMLGAGTDVRIKGQLFARFTADVVDNWDASTRFGRGTAGFAFHFGDRGRNR